MKIENRHCSFEISILATPIFILVVALVFLIATLSLKTTHVAPLFIDVVTLVFIATTYSCLQDPTPHPLLDYAMCFVLVFARCWHQGWIDYLVVFARCVHVLA